MPGPQAVQTLQMPHPRDWQGGQMPRSRPVGWAPHGKRWKFNKRRGVKSNKFALGPPDSPCFSTFRWTVTGKQLERIEKDRILQLTWQSSSVQVRFNISLSSCRSKMTHFLHSVKMAGNEHTLLKHEKPPRRNFSTNFNYSSEVDIEGLVDETTNIGHSSRSTFAWWRSSQLLHRKLSCGIVRCNSKDEF